MKSWLIIFYREMGRKRRVVGTVSSISVRLNALFPIRCLYELLLLKCGLDYQTDCGVDDVKLHLGRNNSMHQQCASHQIGREKKISL